MGDDVIDMVRWRDGAWGTVAGEPEQRRRHGARLEFERCTEASDREGGMAVVVEQVLERVALEFGLPTSVGKEALWCSREFSACH